MAKLITLKEFAKKLNKPESTIRTWKSRGDIPKELFFTIGSSVFIKEDLFDEWVEKTA